MIRPLFYVLLTLFITSCNSHTFGEDFGKTDSVFGAWRVVKSDRESMRCWASTPSLASKHEKVQRQFLEITRNEADKILVSVSSGYDYKPGSKAILTISGQPFYLYFNNINDVAFARDDSENAVILLKMKNAGSIALSATTINNVYMTDTYSSQGFADALARIRQLCP